MSEKYFDVSADQSFNNDTTPDTGYFDVSADQTFNNDPNYDPYDFQGGGGSTDANYDAYDYQSPETIAAMNAEPPETLWDSISGSLVKAGTKLYDSVVSRYTATGGGVDWGKMLKDGLVGASAIQAYNQANNPVKTGYQGGIPKYTAVREALPGPAEGVRPGAGGHRYLTDTTYANQAADQSGAGGLAAIKAATGQQATSMDTMNRLGLAGATTADALPKLYQDMLGRAPDAGGAEYWSKQFGPSVSANEISTLRTAAQPEIAARTPVQAAQGGLMGLAKGGSTAKGRYLQGSTDGMSDELPARIDNGQEAALSHGEFVVPADVVSHLGNGNSDAGAKQLYKMMDNIRQARTGNKKQGKEINPDKFTPGGLAGYASGGNVMGFAGETGSVVPSSASVTSGLKGTESSLSNWAGPYVTDMLGKGQALSEQPYQAYSGPLSAGASALQTQAFGNAANLSVPSSIGEAAASAGQAGQKYGQLSYDPMQSTNQYNAVTPYDGMQTTAATFGNEQAQQYMNPYLQQSLDPQIAEARRQSQITQQANNAQMSAAGGFGGGRSAILQAENQRNLGTNLAGITGAGYNTAYTNAMGQFNADQARNMQAQAANVGQQQFGANQAMAGAAQEAQYGQAAQAANVGQQQFGANYGLGALAGQVNAATAQGNLGSQQNAAGLANLNAQLQAGAAQRGIEAEGIAADQAAFAAERDNPYKMVQFQQSLLQGLPLSAQSYNITNNPYAAASNVITGANAVS